MATADAPTPGEPLHVDLPQDQRAAAQARRATRDALTAWRLPGLVDSVVLAVSELVTNAVRHGQPTVFLELLRRSDRVSVRVHDGDPTEPPGAGAGATSDAESGRGLAIVRELADELAVEQVSDDGKVVRVDFDASPDRTPQPEADLRPPPSAEPAAERESAGRPDIAGGAVAHSTGPTAG